MEVDGEDEQKMVGPSPSKKMRRADPGLRGANGKASALEFNILARQGRARASVLRLPHYDCRTPMFMPVGTNGSVKGLTPQQLREVRLRCRSGCHRMSSMSMGDADLLLLPLPKKNTIDVHSWTVTWCWGTRTIWRTGLGRT